jgi:hypothetical protein
MSSETLLLDQSEEKTPSASLRKSFESPRKKPVNLKEDTTLPWVGRTLLWQRVGSIHGFSGEQEKAQDRLGSVEILFENPPYVGRGQTPLRASLEILGELRSGADGADWLEAAIILKRDVVRLRESNYSRHAAVLLALADALTFTEPGEVSSTGGNALVNHALGLLSEPYIAEADEEEFLGELLMAGWNLAPSEEQAADLVD